MSIILKKGEIRKFTCFRCGREFERICFPNQSKRKRIKNYCSKECLFINGHSGSKRIPRLKRKCDFCKKPMLVGPWSLRRGKGKFCSRDCRVKSVTMERTLTTDGYYTVFKDGRKRREHRVVMEDVLGRKLLPEESVHHINCDKTDNRPKNLYLCTREKHAELHGGLEKLITKLVNVGAIEFRDGAYELSA